MCVCVCPAMPTHLRRIEYVDGRGAHGLTVVRGLTGTSKWLFNNVVAGPRRRQLPYILSI